MKVTGIIAEYNPFHKGHKYQLDFCKKNLKSDYVIVAMSGNYVQRGTPALLSKHLRTEMALRCGADLVLEMPVAVSTASAEAFAMGGVSMLDGLNVVDQLCFGSECGEISAMKELAQILVREPKEYQTLLKQFLSDGLSFPAARSKALAEYFSDPHNFDGNDFDGVLSPLLNQILQILNSPNNILGIEYCKALIHLNSSIRPITLKRQGMGYHEILTTTSQCNDFASATAIRELLSFPLSSDNLFLIKNQVPEETASLLEKALEKDNFLTENALDTILFYRLLEKTYLSKENSSSLSAYLDVSNDLAERISNQMNEIHGFSQAASLLKTKELTQTRIQRALLHIILGIENAPYKVPYARVLGFRKESSPLLKEIKVKTSIPLITKLADADNLLDQEGKKLLDETTFASNLYEKLLCQKNGSPFIHEYQKQLVLI